MTTANLHVKTKSTCRTANFRSAHYTDRTIDECTENMYRQKKERHKETNDKMKRSTKAKTRQDKTRQDKTRKKKIIINSNFYL